MVLSRTSFQICHPLHFVHFLCAHSHGLLFYLKFYQWNGFCGVPEVGDAVAVDEIVAQIETDKVCLHWVLCFYDSELIDLYNMVKPTIDQSRDYVLHLALFKS